MRSFLSFFNKHHCRDGRYCNLSFYGLQCLGAGNIVCYDQIPASGGERDLFISICCTEDHEDIGSRLKKYITPQMECTNMRMITMDRNQIGKYIISTGHAKSRVRLAEPDQTFIVFQGFLIFFPFQLRGAGLSVPLRCSCHAVRG